MGYGIDLGSITLEKYRDMLKAKDLLPSRRMLRDNIDGVFELLGNAGFISAKELYKRLGSVKMLESVSKSTGVSEEYLTLLKRELGSLVPKVVSLSQFPELSPELVSRLADAGINNSKHVHAATGGFTDPYKLCETAGISQDESTEICALCDFVRVNGIAALFARILYDTGYRAISDIAGEDAQHFISAVNPELAEKYDVNPLGLKDAQYCIDYALLLINHS